MADQSLISDDLRSQIGRTSDSCAVTITPEAIARSGDVGGVEFRHGGVAPGFVLTHLGPNGPALDLPERMSASLLISNEFALERPVRVGEELHARARIADISERLGGRFGHALYVRTEVDFFEPGGSPVGRGASTMMYYDPASAADREEER